MNSGKNCSSASKHTQGTTPYLEGRFSASKRSLEGIAPCGQLSPLAEELLIRQNSYESVSRMRQKVEESIMVGV